MKSPALKLGVPVLLLGLGAWWFLARHGFDVPNPKQLVQAAPVPVKVTFEVTANHQMEWTFSTPDGKAPGLFEGRWDSQGSSAKIRGANDDSLVGFVLRGPDNKVMDQLDHPTSGIFSVRFSGPGKCVFVFDNSGIIRSSSRKVTINGTYHPD